MKREAQWFSVSYILVIASMTVFSVIHLSCGVSSELPQTEAQPSTPLNVQITPIGIPGEVAEVRGAGESQESRTGKNTGPGYDTERSSNEVLWFKWFNDRARYWDSGKEDAQIEAKLEDTEKLLREKIEAKRITDALELVAFDWRMLEKNMEEGKSVTHQMGWLFRKTGEIRPKENHRIEILLHGIPDKALEHFLVSDKHPDRKRLEYQYTVTPQLVGASIGEYILITRKVNVPAIPYRMRTFLVEQAMQEDGTWKYAGPFGDIVELGWRADLD